MARDHVDVLIVGAGLSGIGAACHLQARCPQKSYAILEARDCIGGTWDLFRYPGVRSDSDMYTLGYSFKPWPDSRSIADGPSILQYIRQAASEHGVEQQVCFNHRVLRASWAAADARWTVDAERTDTGELVHISCDFLLMCTGYYEYDHGYTPSFPGVDAFPGPIVHPQQWTDDIEYAGKRVLVIGSGATAVTLVPALAKRAAHVTMVQRSPSYVVSLPGVDPLAQRLRRLLPPKLAYGLVRWKNVLLSSAFFALSRRRPRMIKRFIRRGVESQLPAGFDVDAHFKPRYNPWDQRLCLAPDGDLFAALGSGRASVVTDEIETFTERGVRLASGAVLEADLIVTATGLRMLPLGGVACSVDGRDVELPKTMTYRGMMLSGVPNLAFAVGYTNASWTLKCDLTCAYVCRLLNFMDERGYRVCTPCLRDPTVRPLPLIDFSSGYVQRSIDRFPRQGSKLPWRLYQSYPLDIVALRFGPIDDGTLEFSAGAAPQLPAALKHARWGYAGLDTT